MILCFALLDLQGVGGRLSVSFEGRSFEGGTCTSWSLLLGAVAAEQEFAVAEVSIRREAGACVVLMSSKAETVSPYASVSSMHPS